MNHQYQPHDSGPKSVWRSRYAIGLLIMGAIAGFFLLSEHRAHVFGALPFLLFLGCPLMHLFMHHGHGGHDNAPGPPQAGADKPVQPKQGDPL